MTFRISSVQGLSALLSTAIMATFFLAITHQSSESRPVLPTQHISVALVSNGVIVAQRDHVPVTSQTTHVDLLPVNTSAQLAVASKVNLNQVTLQVAPEVSGPSAPVLGWVSFHSTTVNMISPSSADGPASKQDLKQVSTVRTIRLPWSVGAAGGNQISLPLAGDAVALSSADNARILRITIDPSSPKDVPHSGRISRTPTTNGGV